MNSTFIIRLIFFLFFTSTQLSNGAILDSLRMENINGKNFVIHKVDKGQTLFGTLKKYGTSLAEYQEANPNANTDIKINQLLHIPYNKQISNKIETKAAAKVSDSNVCIVEAGMTLSKIAKKYKTTVEALRKINNLETDTIEIDQEILIREVKSTATKLIEPKIYVVEAGMTLFKIAKNNKITVADLKRFNNLENDTIEIGQELVVNEGNVPKTKIVAPAEVPVKEKVKVAEVIKVPEKEIIVVKKEKVVEEVKKEIPTKVQQTKKVEVVEVPKPKVIEVAKPIIDSAKIKSEVLAKSEVLETPNYTERVVKVEEGIAELISVESKSGKYLALHKSAPLGTLIQVKNETNGASVWVKVIGRLPEVDQNENIVIKLSPKAMNRVSPVDKRFRAKLNYSL